MRSVLALAVVALVAVMANGEHLFEDVPSSVPQQRSLLQTTAAPPPTYGARVIASANIYLLLKATKTADLNAAKYGLAHFNARIKPTLRKFNAAYKGANLNFRAKYLSGPMTIAMGKQGWLKYSFAVDLGPAGAAYSAALRSALRSALRKKSLLVKVTRGNIA